VEENKLQPQQRLDYNLMMPNIINLTDEPPPGPPPSLQKSVIIKLKMLCIVKFNYDTNL